MRSRQIDIFVKLTSLTTLVVLTATGDPREMTERLVRDGYSARRVGPDIIVIEEKT